MKKLLLLGLCCGTTLVAFAASSSVPTTVGAPTGVNASQNPVKPMPGMTEHEALYYQLKQKGQEIPTWLGTAVNGAPQHGEPSRQGGDFASNATVIPSLPYTDTGTTVGYGSEVGNPAPDVFYSLTVAATTVTTVSLCATSPSWDSYLRIYVNNAGVVGAQLTSNDDSCGLLSQITDYTLAAGSYFIVVDGYSSYSGAYTINVTALAGNPCDNYSVTNVGDISTTNYSGTFNTVGAPNVFGNSAPDIGYDFTVSAAGNYFFSTCYPATLMDSDFYLLSINPCTGTPTQLYYVDGNCTGGGNSYNANAVWTLAPGSYHLVLTDYYAGTTGSGDFTIEMQQPCVPYDCTALPSEGEAYYTGDDSTNGGCNLAVPIYSPLACGDDWCGNFHTFVHDVSGLQTRDMDWYSFTLLESKPVTATAFSCATGYNMWVIGTDCSTQYGFVSGTGDLSLTTPCLPAGTYYFVIAPSAYDNCPIETGYHATFSCGTVCDMAPNITATCIGDQETAGPWNISADITDDFGITAATLYWNVNYGTYTGVVMTNTVGSTYEAQIPDQPVGSYVGYYFEAIDTGGNVTTLGTCYFNVFNATYAPQNLLASDGNYGSVTLTWDYPGAPVLTLESLVASGLTKEQAMQRLSPNEANRTFTGYQIYRDEVVVGTVPSYYTLTFNDVPPSFNTVYTYRVTALWTSGESNSSNSDTGFMLAPPSSGGPDAACYKWVNSLDPSGSVTYDWFDISTLGVVLPITGDDSTTPVALPFAFPFYGASYTTANVCTNGWLNFGASSTAYTNQPLPTAGAPDATVAVLWEDMYVDASAAVYHYDDLANNRVIFQWNNIYWLGNSAYRYTFQVFLNADGSIKIQYASVEEANLASSTVGIENADGTIGLQVNYNGGGGMIADLLAIAISPFGAMNPVAVAMVSGNANLGWTAVPGAATYSVYGSAEPYSGFAVIGSTATNSFVDVGAQAAGRKFYKVTAVCN